MDGATVRPPRPRLNLGLLPLDGLLAGDDALYYNGKQLSNCNITFCLPNGMKEEGGLELVAVVCVVARAVRQKTAADGTMFAEVSPGWC